jgi:hypothetical protein
VCCRATTRATPFHKLEQFLDEYLDAAGIRNGSPLAATRAELEQLAGYWPDVEKSRAEARRLLKEAGAEGLIFELLNRNVDQPYKFNALWVIDEWSKIGVKVTQRVVPTGPLARRCAVASSKRCSTAIARTLSTRCSMAQSTCRIRCRPQITGIHAPEAVAA